MPSRSTTLAAALAFSVITAPTVSPALSTPEQTSLQGCQVAVGVQGELLVRDRIKALDLCLGTIAAKLIGFDLGTTAGAVSTCVSNLRKLTDSRAQVRDLGERFVANVNAKCDPALKPHALEDILGTGAGVPEPIHAENVGNWCGGFGGDGAIDTYEEWRDCVLDSHVLLADTAVSTQYPRAIEWLGAVRLHIAALLPPTSDPSKVADVLAALDAVVARLEGLADDDIPINQAGTQLPASGQTTQYVNGDDGGVQAGAMLRYVDNGDGTITDLNTGLMWEKKSDDASLHDWGNCHPWRGSCSTAATECGTDSDCPATETCDAGDCQASLPNGLTIFEWVAALNAAGFAGHSDWRIPSARELHSIVDLGRFGPSVDPVFTTGCAASCPVTTCSCTASSFYWSSSTDAFDPTLAWVVIFGSGQLAHDNKAFGNDFVRAVRGGP